MRFENSSRECAFVGYYLLDVPLNDRTRFCFFQPWRPND
jgi:hypothetical protein